MDLLLATDYYVEQRQGLDGTSSPRRCLFSQSLNILYVLVNTGREFHYHRNVKTLCLNFSWIITYITYLGQLYANFLILIRADIDLAKKIFQYFECVSIVD